MLLNVKAINPLRSSECSSHHIEYTDVNSKVPRELERDRYWMYLYLSHLAYPPDTVYAGCKYRRCMVDGVDGVDGVGCR